eukprot:g835.t1
MKVLYAQLLYCAYTVEALRIDDQLTLVAQRERDLFEQPRGSLLSAGADAYTDKTLTSSISLAESTSEETGSSTTKKFDLHALAQEFLSKLNHESSPLNSLLNKKSSSIVDPAAMSDLAGKSDLEIVQEWLGGQITEAFKANVPADATSTAVNTALHTLMKSFAGAASALIAGGAVSGLTPEQKIQVSQVLDDLGEYDGPPEGVSAEIAAAVAKIAAVMNVPAPPPVVPPVPAPVGRKKKSIVRDDLFMKHDLLEPPEESFKDTAWFAMDIGDAKKAHAQAEAEKANAAAGQAFLELEEVEDAAATNEETAEAEEAAAEAGALMF